MSDWNQNICLCVELLTKMQETLISSVILFGQTQVFKNFACVASPISTTGRGKICIWFDKWNTKMFDSVMYFMYFNNETIWLLFMIKIKIPNVTSVFYKMWCQLLCMICQTKELSMRGTKWTEHHHIKDKRYGGYSQKFLKTDVWVITSLHTFRFF